MLEYLCCQKKNFNAIFIDLDLCLWDDCQRIIRIKKLKKYSKNQAKMYDDQVRYMKPFIFTSDWQGKVK